MSAGLTSLIEHLRDRLRPRMPHAEFQDLTDFELYLRLAGTVDMAIATANVSQVDTDVAGGVLHTCVWWSWKREADTSAQRTIHPGGRTDHAIHVQTWDPHVSLWLFSGPEAPIVRWMPGMGFTDPVQFLDWFERETIGQS